MEQPYDFDYVARRMAEAGMTLLALQVSGCFPAGFRSNLPSLPTPSTENDMRAAAPTPKRIRDMDEALEWAKLIPDSKLVVRKLVLSRMLTSPQNEKPIYSWRKLAEMFHCSHVGAKSWWISGIEIIVARLNQPGLCQMPQFRRTRQDAETALRRAAGHAVPARRTAERQLAEV